MTTSRTAASAAPSPALKNGSRAHLSSAVVARLGTLVVKTGFLVGLARGPRPYVVLATREAAAMHGNLRFIRDELARRRLPIRVVVLGYKTRAGLGGAAVSAWEALRAGYHLAAARLFVADNWFFPADVVGTRAGTFRVQVWHAAGAFKKFGYSLHTGRGGAGDGLSGLVPTTSTYDLCLVSSTEAAAAFSEAFNLPRERFTSALGIPRTDLFFDSERCTAAAAAVRRRYGIQAGRRVALYAPTYRGDRVRDARTPQDLDVAAIRDGLGAEWLLLVRSHPLVRGSTPRAPEQAAFAIDVSDWPEINELMLVADVLVTDYSSAAFEFALLRRPMLFLAPDVDRYEADRGFYIDVRRDLPGPLVATTRELVAQLRALPVDHAPVAAFARRWFDVADGRSAARFVDLVVLPAVRGQRPAVEREPGPAGRGVVDPACGAGAGWV